MNIEKRKKALERADQLLYALEDVEEAIQGLKAGQLAKVAFSTTNGRVIHAGNIMLDVNTFAKEHKPQLLKTLEDHKTKLYQELNTLITFKGDK